VKDAAACSEAPERRENRKSWAARKLDNTQFKGRQWLYVAPLLIAGVLVVGMAGEALELFGFLLRLACGSCCCRAGSPNCSCGRCSPCRCG
jgi:hypothetical protein